MFEVPDGPGARHYDRVRRDAARDAAPDRACVVVVTADERQQRHLVQRMLTEAGLTPTTAAAQLGVHPESIRQYVTGHRRVTLEWLLRLATLCRVTVAVHLANGGR
jgi:hypothetical protein